MGPFLVLHPTDSKRQEPRLIDAAALMRELRALWAATPLAIVIRAATARR